MTPAGLVHAIRLWGKARRPCLVWAAVLLSIIAYPLTWPLPVGSGDSVVHSWEIVASHCAALATFGLMSRMRGWDRLASGRVTTLGALATSATIVWVALLPWATIAVLDRVPYRWIPWAGTRLTPDNHTISEVLSHSFRLVLTLNNLATAAAVIILCTLLGRHIGFVTSIATIWIVYAAGFSSGQPVLRVGYLSDITAARLLGVAALAALSVMLSTARAKPTDIARRAAQSALVHQVGSTQHHNSGPDHEPASHLSGGESAS